MSSLSPAVVTAPGPAPAVGLPAGPSLRIGARRIPVVLPRLGDPRLKLLAIIVVLQTLGQTVLDWKVSIAQILITIGVCAVVDGTITYRREGILAWPASAIQTGNSIAFILRASGTEHGDWWSLNGIHWFVLAALVALLVKYLVRPGDRHRFNPSNIGLVWVLLVIGPVHVFPQYLWWGEPGPPVIAALGVIVLGSLVLLRQVRMLAMAASFLVPFLALIAVCALAGNRFVAVWQQGWISGFDYWLKICTSPELLIFTFLMMSDPGTAPKSARGRVLYGVITAVLAAGLVSLQTTEFGVKVAILASLTIVCAVVPLIETAAARRGAAWSPARDLATRRYGLRPVGLAVLLVALLALVGTAALPQNQDLVLIERGLAGAEAAQ